MFGDIQSSALVILINGTAIYKKVTLVYERNSHEESKKYKAKRQQILFVLLSP
jgi:hypothetical protein